MARQPSKQDVFDALLAKYDKAISEAFRKAVNDLRDNADLARIIRAISANDTNELIDALHLDKVAFTDLNNAITRAYQESGTTSAGQLPELRDGTGARTVIRFDPGYPRAAAWVADHSAGLVTSILDDQRVAIRQALKAGLESGANPRTVALDIVGRLSRATGQREGGIVGLTSQQEQFVASARQELASGDATQLRRYMARKARDQRFDRSVLKAIQKGESLDADTIQRATARYSDRLLKLRGDTIGRTESLTSLHAAKQEAYLQAVDKGALQEQNVLRVWRSVGDFRVRHTHTVLNRETAGLREPFTSPSGAVLMYPGDPSAPPAEIINCRCDLTYRIFPARNAV